MQNKHGVMALGETAGENFLDAFIVFSWHKAITNNRSSCRSSLLTHGNWQIKWSYFLEKNVSANIVLKN